MLPNWLRTLDEMALSSNITRGKDPQKVEIARDAYRDQVAEGRDPNAINPQAKPRPANGDDLDLLNTPAPAPGNSGTSSRYLHPWPGMSDDERARLLSECEALLKKIERGKQPVQEVPPLFHDRHQQKEGGKMNVKLAVSELERASGVGREDRETVATLLKALREAKELQWEVEEAEQLMELCSEISEAANGEEPEGKETVEPAPADSANFSLTDRPAPSPARLKQAERELMRAAGL